MLSHSENIKNLEQINTDIEKELVNRNKDINQIKYQYQVETNNLQESLALEQRETKSRYIFI